MQIRATAFLTAAALAIALAPDRADAQRGCEKPQGAVLAISAEPVQAAPGDTARVGVAWYVGGYAPPLPVPSRCRVGWTVRPAAAARIDSRGRMTVAAAARPGTEFRVVARVGRDSAAQAVHVVDPRPNPLAGWWSMPDPARCAGGAAALPAPEPVRELVFRRDSAFSLTVVPFESYRDYWGRYSWNATTGALRLRIDGGNRLDPDADLDGVARVNGDRLTLEGFWLGDPTQPRGGRTCTYVFARRR